MFGMAQAERLAAWMRERVTEAGAQGLVVGLSGGVDSAVVARLSQLAAPGATVGVLMPFFFMLTGLRTQIDLGSTGFLEILLVTTGLAVLGNVGGTALAARSVGESWANALGLGAVSAGSSVYLKVGVKLPSTADNTVQGRKAAIDVSWMLEQ